MYQINSILLAVAVVASLAVLNRVRGGGFGGDKLPGRALLWVSVAVGLIATAVSPASTITLPIYGTVTGSWVTGTAWGLGYLFWGLWSWGYILAALGDYAPPRSPGTLESALMLLPGDVTAAFARMLFVLPGVALVAWLLSTPWFPLAAPLFAAAATACYTILFRPLGTADWQRAEIATGACWGLLILSPWVLR